VVPEGSTTVVIVNTPGAAPFDEPADPVCPELPLSLPDVPELDVPFAGGAPELAPGEDTELPLSVPDVPELDAPLAEGVSELAPVEDVGVNSAGKPLELVDEVAAESVRQAHPRRNAQSISKQKRRFIKLQLGRIFGIASISHWIIVVTVH
jgi:hypothetical protein